jgi:predicted deacetylase
MNMSRAKYILRLDDACHQMPLEKWKIFETFFDKNNIKPIIGVIPLNKDNSLGSETNHNFWELIKSWKNKGWSIAMHGLHHQCKKIKPEDSFFKFGNKSEFVGKSLEDQTKIVEQSILCFRENNIEPNIFMAPSHTFDLLTLKALELSTRIRIVTDGFSFRTFKKNNFIFIPQQLWSVWKMPFGLYTICIHPTTMKTDQIHKFIEELDRISDQIISPSEIDLKSTKNQGFLDWIFENIYLFISRYKFKEK